MSLLNTWPLRVPVDKAFLFSNVLYKMHLSSYISNWSSRPQPAQKYSIKKICAPWPHLRTTLHIIFFRNRHIKAYDKTKYAQMRNEIRKQVNEVDNVSRHLMNGTAVFDHWHRCYLVIIYSSNQSADTESREEERENRWRCTERQNLL